MNMMKWKIKAKRVEKCQTNNKFTCTCIRAGNNGHMVVSQDYQPNKSSSVIPCFSLSHITCNFPMRLNINPSPPS